MCKDKKKIAKILKQKMFRKITYVQFFLDFFKTAEYFRSFLQYLLITNKILYISVKTLLIC